MRVLIVDGDEASAQRLADDLSVLGVEAHLARDGESALSLAESVRFEAILLDTLLPGADGREITRELRLRNVDTPILLISAAHGLDDRVRGLEAGADDFLAKPAAPAEIKARVRAIHRRAARHARAPSQEMHGQIASGAMRAGAIEVDEARMTASRSGRPLDLQRLEFLILCELVRHAGEVVTREKLYKTIWNLDRPPRSNIVESHVRRLRRELVAKRESDPIATVRGLGYRLVIEQTAS